MEIMDSEEVEEVEEVCRVKKSQTFEEELEHLINRHSKENGSNTPDFILAQYISGCLLAFEAAVQQRETWYGRDPRPAHMRYGRMLEG